MKIVNKVKFLRSVIIVIGLMILLLFSYSNSYSKVKVSYKENYIFEGDTLWSIANEEIQNNDYFKGKDIKKVIYEIQELNNLCNKNLEIGSKILIPYI